MRKFVLSTVGISLLTNQAENAWRQRLNAEANRTEAIPDEVAAYLAEASAALAQALEQAEPSARGRMSAELNGLYALYEGRLDRGSADCHCLLTTDTILGRRCAELLRDFLRGQGLTVLDPVAPKGLSAASAEAFRDGMKALIAWCEESIPSYKDHGYTIVFNLSAGLKSLQGYLNIVGMFYADTIGYIFETSNELVRIPRLPLRIDTDALRPGAALLAMMAHNHLAKQSEVQTLPEALFDIADVDGQALAALSNWGLLTWNRARRDLLAPESLLPFPGLEYEDSFRREYQDASPQERIQLQDTLAKVAAILASSPDGIAALKQDGGLQYDNYTGRIRGVEEPVGHFRLDSGRRVSCVARGNSLRLRHFGPHDKVNGAP